MEKVYYPRAPVMTSQPRGPDQVGKEAGADGARNARCTASSSQAVYWTRCRQDEHGPMLRLLAALAVLLTLSCARQSDPVSWLPVLHPARDLGWTQDAAGDHLDLDHEREDGLGVVVHCGGRNQGILRREVDWDATHLGRLVMEVTVEQDTSLALALRGQRGGWFETPVVSLAPGWHRQVPFDLAGLEGQADWPKYRSQIDRVMVLVKTGKQAKGPQRLRVHSVSADAPVERRAQIVAKPLMPVETGVDGCWTWTLTLKPGPQVPRKKEGVASEAFAEALAGQLRVRGPDGAVREVTGYLDGVDAEGWLSYRFRFLPPLSGTWQAELGHDDGRQWTWQSAGMPSTALARTPLRVSPQDPRALEHGSGEPCWLLGQNLAWMGEAEPWFAALNQALASQSPVPAKPDGMTHPGALARVWLCPWHGWLFSGDRWVQVDQAEAARVDALFAAAAQHNIQVILVLAHHGLWSGEWDRNPANAALGGPCRRPEDTWRDREARAAWRTYLSYVVARWGAEPALAGWELLNEANLVRRDDDEDLLAWHREMAAHLRRADAHGHLITTSVSEPGSLRGLWRLEDIDLVQVHAYEPRLEPALDAATELSRMIPKPLLLGELGRDFHPTGDQVDRQGRFLRRALWSSWMLPTAAAAMPWWWDTHLAPQGQLTHFRGLAAYAAVEDRRGQDLRPVVTVLHRDGREPVRVRALLGRDRVWAYLCTPPPADQLLTAAPAGPVLAPGAVLSLAGLADGTWRIEWWDCAAGTARAGGMATVASGRAELILPEIVEDLAIKLVREPVSAAAVDLRPASP